MHGTVREAVLEPGGQGRVGGGTPAFPNSPGLRVPPTTPTRSQNDHGGAGRMLSRAAQARGICETASSGLRSVLKSISVRHAGSLTARVGQDDNWHSLLVGRKSMAPEEEAIILWGIITRRRVF